MHFPVLGTERIHSPFIAVFVFVCVLLNQESTFSQSPSTLCAPDPASPSTVEEEMADSPRRLRTATWQPLRLCLLTCTSLSGAAAERGGAAVPGRKQPAKDAGGRAAGAHPTPPAGLLAGEEAGAHRPRPCSCRHCHYCRWGRRPELLAEPVEREGDPGHGPTGVPAVSDCPHVKSGITRVLHTQLWDWWAIVSLFNSHNNS